MYSFTKNNKFIFIAGSLFVVVLAAIVGLMLLSTNKSSKQNQNDNPFAETDENRQFDGNTENAFLFGTSSERFIAKKDVKKVPVFRALTNKPSAGAVVFEKNEDDNIFQFTRYVSASNGHVFDVPIDYIDDEKKVSKKTVLNILNTVWSKKADVVFLQYYNEDNTNVFGYIEHIDENNSDVKSTFFSTTDKNGRPVVGKIIASAISPNNDRVFYLEETENNVIGFLEDIKTGDKTEIWSSPLKSLSVSWTSPKKILVYTKPSKIAESVVWLLSPTGNSESVLLSKQYSISPKMDSGGKKILYSIQEGRNGPFSLHVLNLKNDETIHMPLTTIAEKCVWDNTSSRYVYCAVPKTTISNGFLEKWYSGEINTDDILWRMDTETGVIKKLFDPNEKTGEKFDIENLMLTPDENYLVFNTRVNKILWSLKLPNKPTDITTGE
jgi:hypothetical protein